MSLKKVRGSVTGFGDTLVSKTCLFFFKVVMSLCRYSTVHVEWDCILCLCMPGLTYTTAYNISRWPFTLMNKQYTCMHLD